MYSRRVAKGSFILKGISDSEKEQVLQSKGGGKGMSGMN